MDSTCGPIYRSHKIVEICVNGASLGRDADSPQGLRNGRSQTTQRDTLSFTSITRRQINGSIVCPSVQVLFTQPFCRDKGNGVLKSDKMNSSILRQWRCHGTTADSSPVAVVPWEQPVSPTATLGVVQCAILSFALLRCSTLEFVHFVSVVNFRDS